MGLFDNLFLDQNTPVTINDGVDHSKDIVTHVVDPTEDTPEPSKPLGARGEPQDDKKKDDSISDLFESDKKEEKEADAALHPEPPKDIALEIGKAPEANGSIAPLDPNSEITSFDIGGDISFDTLPESSLVTDQTTPLEGDVTADPTLSPTLTLTSPTEAIAQDASSTFLSPSGALGDASQPLESANQAPEAVALEEKKEESSPETPAPTPATTDTSGGIFGLIGGGDATPEAATITPPETPAPTPIIADAIPVGAPETPVLGGMSIPDKDATPLPAEATAPISSGSTTMESLLGRDALALFKDGGQTSTLLREKLNTFIEELKVLHSRDQSQRYHKLEQIAMYEERIREIDAEAATRKRVLQAEIDDLKRQIEMMDREKDDIQEVITTFRKEIGNS